VTSGRFWLGDLARELSHRGHDVRLYSVVPPHLLERFGIPRRCMRWLGPLLAGHAWMARRGPRRWRSLTDRLLMERIEAVVAKVLEPCDVFIALSGLGGQAARTARRRFKARIFIERGSRHILSQRSILEALASRSQGVKAIEDWAVERELADYNVADLIVVPSRHAQESFLAEGVPANRVARNPYGVDLEMFPTSPELPRRSRPATVMVGTWSYRKGSDLLTEAWRNGHFQLTHVGSIQDCPLPVGPGFEHVPPVAQSALPGRYAQAHLAVLPSREEGFGMVLSQALACGRPIVCSDRTGGPDLQEIVGPDWVRLVPHENVRELETAILEVAAQASRPSLPDEIRNRLSWRSYGERYDGLLRA
jgi:glycosyltransferase involved in cell wall biosynthesis